MDLHEFQAKELLAKQGVPIPRGRLADSAEDAERIARRLGFEQFVVKAQVRAGDRAAHGGVRFASDPQEVGRIASDLIGRPLLRGRTGPAGRRVQWVYIEEAIATARSLYAAVVVDAAAGELILLCGAHEFAKHAIANESPNPLFRTRLIPNSAGVVADFDAAAEACSRGAGRVPGLADMLQRLANAAVALDALLVEVSPLALTRTGNLVALDAKIRLDDNSLFRHPDLAALSEATETDTGDPMELEAQRHQINYMLLDGDIGVVVNGAGLALATLDLIEDAGGKPANFMDIRTTASSLDIAYGFGLIAANPRVRVVLINVHGGGMQRCDTIADGVAIAMHRTGCALPLVIRLAGNNADFASTRLRSYGLACYEAANMWEAATAAVTISKQKAA
jgi:succinyl-CoA synthetase beta subunit